METFIRQSFEPWPSPTGGVAVLFDIFRASTTLATLLRQAPREIVSSNDEATVRGLAASGYRMFSEVFAGDLDNSPSQVLSLDLRGQRIVHKSTNLTTALFHIFPKVDRVLIGSFVNLTRLMEVIRSLKPSHVHLVAAGHFQKARPAVEDTACAELTAQWLRGQPSQVIPYQQEINEKLARLRAEGTKPAHFWRDAEIALTIDAHPFLPEAKMLANGTVEMVSFA